MIEEEEYYAQFPPKENPNELPTPPFNVEPHWSIPVIIIICFLAVGVGWGVFIWVALCLHG